MQKPKFRPVVKATHRVSGYVLEGDELTPTMQQFVLRNQDVFEVELEKAPVLPAKAVSEAPSGVSEAAEGEEAGGDGEPSDPTKFTRAQLNTFDKNGLLATARELGLLVEASYTKAEIIDEILNFQNAPA